MPAVSIIIPMYNVEAYIDKCMHSVLNQTMKDYEVIVIDDGSKDASYEKAAWYEKLYPTQVRVYRQKNAGQGDARNSGVLLAKGEYILFVDSDDTVADHFVEEAYKVAKREDADIVLYLNYPAHSPVEVFEEKSAGYDERHLDAFTESIIRSVQAGKVTALADGAFCNGGDKEFLRALNEKMDILSLSAYAGWNTSSNTLGTVICQAVFVFLFGDNKHQKRFLAERLYEDVGYCGYVRSYVTQNLLPSLGYDYFNAGETAGEVAGLVKKELVAFMDKYFPNIAEVYDIRICQMPWRRMFEVDLALTEKV